MIDIKKLYYAHHMFKYNTKEEKQEIELIEKKFPNFLIINPILYVVAAAIYVNTFVPLLVMDGSIKTIPNRLLWINATIL